MAVVGLSTTNPADAIAPLADIVIPDYYSLGRLGDSLRQTGTFAALLGQLQRLLEVAR